MLFVFLTSCCFHWILAQNNNKIHVKTCNSLIQIDGVIDEESWQKADSVGSFWQNFPYDTSFAQTKTKVKLLADKKYLYIAAICIDRIEGDYVVQTLKRDFIINNSDAFSVHIDPYNDQSNGFAFSQSLWSAM
ncbi:MAG: hypothetical protein R2852_01555 [Bacteroidia bacterium]